MGLVWCGALVALWFTGCSPPGGSADQDPDQGDIKIGYLVKQPDEPWFQVEWQFAAKAGEEHGFKVIQLATP